ncbi:MAG: acyltransferase family protein [Lachnospiraceae bacterium]|nr:acyltransferase family protein [Lachnospiraceae bacterium]
MQDRNRRFSILRVFAGFGIVLLHTANVSEILYRDSITPGQTALSLGIVYCMMWAVPCFLMVSGALLLDPARMITMEKLFSHYLKRVFLALLVCSVFFRFFDMMMGEEGFYLMFVPDGVWQMFHGTGWAHMWYLYLLIGLYLLLPFFRMITAHSTDRELCYLLVVYAVFLSVFPLFRTIDAEIAFTLPTAGIYPFYFFAGYVLYKGKWKIDRKAAFLMTVIATGLIMMLTKSRYSGLSGDAASFADGLIASYSSPLIVIQSVGLFSLVCCGTAKEPSENKSAARGWLTEFIDLFDSCGFGIYLLHMVFLRLFLRYQGWNPFLMGMWSIFAIAFGVFLLTCALVAVLRRIPFVMKNQDQCHS